MLKRASILIITLAILLNSISFAAAAETEIKIQINNVYQNYEQKPVMINNTTMVPLRGIFETLGAKVDWNGTTKTITAMKSGTTVILTLGKTTATVNNKTITLAVPAQTIAGRTVVPLRFVSEALGATVNWEGATRTIRIYSNPVTNANLVFTVDGEPNLDILNVMTNDQLELMNNVYEGLFRMGPNGEYQLAMAKDYQVSADGLTWTFHLRDVKWSDGTPVTAEDFIYGITRASESIYSFLFDRYVLEAVAEDSKTLVMHLEHPVSFFQSILVQPTFFPIKQAFVEKVGDNYGSQNGVLANGPFKVSNWEANKSITLVKNEHYWDAANVKVNQITLNIINNNEEKLNLYLNNQLDMYELASADIPSFKNNVTYQNQLYSSSNGVGYYLYFNTEHQVLQNKNIRKAISWAIDRQSFINELKIYSGKPLAGLVPPQMPASSKLDIRTNNGVLVDYNMQKAKEYLALGLKELHISSMPTYNMVIYNNEKSILLGEFLKKSLAEIGVKIELQAVSFAEAIKKQRSGDFDLTINGWGPDYNHPMTFTELFATDGSYNYGQWSDPKYDELLVQSYLADSIEDSILPLLEAEKYLIQEEAVVAPLYYLERTFLVKPTLKGYQFQASSPYADWKWLNKY